MPRDSYSYSGDSGQRPIPISEPGAQFTQSRQMIERDEFGPAQGIQAKEPDRQSTTRRATRSNRAKTSVKEQAEQPRNRTASRAGARGGAQPRRAAERETAARRTDSETKTGRQKKSRRGFAAMSPEQQKEIARKGGLTVSRNRRHMADIGRIGGEHSHGGRRGRR